uniref:Uncharacterized protein n=1 Tax=Picornavirales sp. TaxID=1955153 RepID=A0A6M3YNY7_9VIRU|nr:MAG: hypothetical protein 2 [Picornavirales sp.]
MSIWDVDDTPSSSIFSLRDGDSEEHGTTRCDSSEILPQRGISDSLRRRLTNMRISAFSGVHSPPIVADFRPAATLRSGVSGVSRVVGEQHSRGRRDGSVPSSELHDRVLIREPSPQVVDSNGARRNRGGSRPKKDSISVGSHRRAIPQCHELSGQSRCRVTSRRRSSDSEFESLEGHCITEPSPPEHGAGRREASGSRTIHARERQSGGFVNNTGRPTIHYAERTYILGCSGNAFCFDSDVIGEQSGVSGRTEGSSTSGSATNLHPGSWTSGCLRSGFETYSTKHWRNHNRGRRTQDYRPEFRYSAGCGSRVTRLAYIAASVQRYAGHRGKADAVGTAEQLGIAERVIQWEIDILSEMSETLPQFWGSLWDRARCPTSRREFLMRKYCESKQETVNLKYVTGTYSTTEFSICSSCGGVRLYRGRSTWCQCERARNGWPKSGRSFIPFRPEEFL